MQYRIESFPESVAAEARTRRIDHFGHALAPIPVDAPSSFPCRVCLHDGVPGEEMLLLSHQPSPAHHPHSVIGPVYVHAHDCTPWSAAGALPPVVRSRLVAVRAYDASGDLIACELAQGAEVESLIAAQFEDGRAAALHLHFARAGCFACRIVRGEPA